MIQFDEKNTDKKPASEDKVDIGAEASQDTGEDCLELAQKTGKRAEGITGARPEARC